MILELLSGIELGIFMNPIMKSIKKRKETNDIYIYGIPQPTQIPILDQQIVKRTGELTFLQRTSVSQLTKFIRRIVNTRSFELSIAYGIKKYWVLDGTIRTDNSDCKS
jgi:hypothetical protein